MFSKEKNIFSVNPDKASSRVMLSSTMLSVLFFVLTLILASGPGNFSRPVMIQIVLAIPFLYVSILAYTKIAYKQDNYLWDLLGWSSVSMGNSLVLNAIGLMIALIDWPLAVTYFVTLIVLMFLYSAINVYYTRLWGVKVFKFLFFVLAWLIGGIWPLFF